MGFLSGVEGGFDWRAAMRTWRQRLGMKQSDLAERAGLSVATIKAYETGKRHPSEAALESIISALGIPREDANLIRDGAGFAIDWRAVLEGRYAPISLGELAEEAARYPWPAFATNQSFEVVVANEAFEAVFDVDLANQYQEFGDRNFFAGITHEEFASRLLNWDEVVTFMCGLVKGDPRWRAEDLGSPAPWLAGPVQRFLEGSPRRISRFMELWETAAPIPSRVRQRFTIEWQHDRGSPLLFEGRLVVGDLFSEIHWNEWIPGNSDTWLRMEELLPARHAR